MGLVVKAKAPLSKIMKRHGNLFHKIVDLDNLYDAFDKAKKGKQHYEGVQKFAAALPYSITNIQTALKYKTFTTSKYMERFLYVPKLRTIYVLPFKDRVVQHALMNITSPIFLNGFVHNTYSCIKGRGVHAGCLKAKEYLYKFRYCLQCDISKFYPSINHEILKEVFRTRIKCKDTLWLMDDIVDSMPGEINVPIGNLTSQWFGNAYMTELDHLIMFEWKTPNYVRYCDDFVMFSNDKCHLRELQAKITEYLAQKRQLKLSKSILFPVSQGLDFLGYRFFRGYTLLRKRTAKRTRRRLLRKTEQFKNSEITFDYYRAILASAKGGCSMQIPITFVGLSILKVCMTY